MPQERFYPESQAPYNSQQYNQNMSNMGAQYVKQMEPSQSTTIARTSEPEKPKLPIPEQHVHLKTVFDELKKQCFENAKNLVRSFFINIIIFINIKKNRQLQFLFSQNSKSNAK